MSLHFTSGVSVAFMVSRIECNAAVDKRVRRKRVVQRAEVDVQRPCGNLESGENLFLLCPLSAGSKTFGVSSLQ